MRCAAKFVFLRWWLGIGLWLLAGHAVSEPLLPKPDAIKPDVDFWKRVYTEINTDQGFIHDDRYLNVVYETVQLEQGIDRRRRNRQVNRVKERYRAVLLKLARESHENLSEEEQRVLSLWPEDVSRRELREASRRLRFQLGQSNKFREGLIRSGRWMGHILQTLYEMELPAELAALPHVESSFNPNAYSFVGAAGMWQFTRSTGRRYMQVDHVVDERLDPFISTRAAAELLKHNFNSTGTWPLAITAYNHGAAGMRRAVRETGGTDIVKILREYDGRAFGFASRNFYVAFLAAVEVNREAEKYFGRIELDPADGTRTVNLPDYVPVRHLADTLGVDFHELRRLNPALRPPVWDGDKYVPRGYALRVPAPVADKADQRLAVLSADFRFSRQAPDVTYQVRRGDALSTIADRFGVSQAELSRMNGLNNRHLIRVGQVLRLPQTRGVAPVRRELVDGTYRVQRGDTLSIIADAFGVAEQQLISQNGLKDRHHIVVGQVLNVTAPEPAAEPAPEEPVQLAAAEPAAAGEEEEITAELTDADGAEAEEAEPVMAEDTEASGPEVTQPALSADPSDYLVNGDRSITVQAGETLGHYAEWLELRASDLRRINDLTFGRPLILGRKLELDFSRVDVETFEMRRVAYHRNLQEAYFSQYQIAGVEERVIRRGESVWELTQLEYGVPLWLFLQYNPDVDIHRLHPGAKVLIPKIRQKPLAG